MSRKNGRQWKKENHRKILLKRNQEEFFGKALRSSEQCNNKRTKTEERNGIRRMRSWSKEN